MERKIPFWRTIQFVYLSILSLGIIVFIGLSFITRSDRDMQNRAIYNDRKSERITSFDVITRLNSQSLKDLTFENTYWDQMVDFIEEPKSKESIEFKSDILASQLETYDASAIWTYNANFELTSNTNTFDTAFENVTLELLPKDFPKVFSKDTHDTHFYAQTPVGIMEVFGSTVHPSSDKDHKTSARGYFLIARTVDDDYTKTLAADSSNNVEVLSLSNVNTKQVNYQPVDGKIAFYKDLKKYDGSVQGQLYVQYDSTAVSHVVKSFNRLLFSIIAGYILLALTVYLIFGRLIIRPLSLVYRALATGKTEPLDKLAGNRSEFGRIADLIVTSFNQRDEIAQILSQKSNAQDSLKKRSLELEHTNSLMINRELRMIELKKKIAELEAQINDKK